jgi:hypothetical protein
MVHVTVAAAVLTSEASKTRRILYRGLLSSVNKIWKRLCDEFLKATGRFEVRLKGKGATDQVYKCPPM